MSVFVVLYRSSPRCTDSSKYFGVLYRSSPRCTDTYLDTWILGVSSKQLRLLHGRVGDSTIVVNSLSPQMSKLVEDAIAS